MAATKGYVDAQIAAIPAATDLTPPGTVIWTARTTAPTGYIKANGAAISRTTYAALFAAIGTAYGSGNGSTTFNVPDLRGEFVRGWDDGRGVDSGRAFGSTQADSLRSHTHELSAGTASDNLAGGTPVKTINYLSTSVSPFATNSTGGTETRPRNIVLLGCIKT
jgi:phage-related tail fiber protein